MISRKDKVRLGIFLTVAALLFLGVLVAFAGLKLFDDGDTYTIYYTESVSGLNVGSQVRLRGVSVGNVRDMRINPKDVEQIEVKIALEPGTPIKADTRAVLTSQGLTGLKYIDLKFGTRAAKKVEPNSVIPAEPGFLTKISGQAENIGKRTDEIMLDVARIVSGENRKKIERILDKSETLVSNTNMLVVEMTKTLVVTREFIEKNEGNLSTTLQNASVASRQLPGIMAESRATLASAKGKIDTVQIEPLLTGLTQTNTSVQAKLDQLDVNRIFATLTTLQTLVIKLINTMGNNQEQVRAMLFNMRRTSDNLKEVSQSIRDKPSRLIFEDKPEPRKLP